MFPDFDKHRVHMHLAPRLLVNISLVAVLLPATLNAPSADPRTLLPDHVGGWQRALFPLRIPVTRLIEGRMRHFTEHCTAVAVTPGPNSLFVSAWHCFEDYRSAITLIQLIDPNTTTPVPMRLLETGAPCRRIGHYSRQIRPSPSIPGSQSPLPPIISDNH